MKKQSRIRKTMYVVLVYTYTCMHTHIYSHIMDEQDKVLKYRLVSLVFLPHDG